MVEKISNLERYRAERKQQVDARRETIIAAAQRLFLAKGLEQTSMRDIAEEAHINRVTLYRYFPDRHPLAFEVAARMLDTIVRATTDSIPPDITGMEVVRATFLNMIRVFDSLREAYLYLGMFDQAYALAYPSEELAQWYKALIFEVFDAAVPIARQDLSDETFIQIVMVGNTITSFLEKMAARGELLSAEQEVPMQTQLAHFETMIGGYLDTLLEEYEGG